MDNSKLTEKQAIEQECFNMIVHEKWDKKSLIVDVGQPSFADYNGDLFDLSKKFIGDFKDKVILEIGCGSGEIGVWLIKNGARQVYGIDISDESIVLANRRSKENGTEQQIKFMVSPGEQTSFENNFFDIVFINVSLHHLILDEALGEIKRILKTGGIFVAAEPFVFSELIQNVRTSNFVTKMYPIRQETPTERILVAADLGMIEQSFGNIEYQPCRMFSPFILKIKPLLHFLANHFFKQEENIEKRRQLVNRKFQKVDETLLRFFPFLRFFSRYILIKSCK